MFLKHYHFRLFTNNVLNSCALITHISRTMFMRVIRNRLGATFVNSIEKRWMELWRIAGSNMSVQLCRNTQRMCTAITSVYYQMVYAGINELSLFQHGSTSASYSTSGWKCCSSCWNANRSHRASDTGDVEVIGGRYIWTSNHTFRNHLGSFFMKKKTMADC